ncbi:hypothetical protein A3J43_00475 [Candidatus Uhrbacteria bacterium RIFCSPHIGHO2_12_FULL_54_23]|uniref:Uncharacterized protein n=3 Tax=Parcubacteria group TaxID=1794811 RepID=A0A1F7UGS9_9BACT|nr:MAG: Adenylyl-sulfate kinase [Candidatus Magasanikbacteria bacterium GW2011_GWA2_50_22]OGL77500.1 MAG: hypothetical protein A3J43_00475 [Candidatus Uhrbacteria bacterium RIFCSPHIGHO2_12_FULL_54_23]OGL90899.1 MAG: hypothetical protein A3J36_02245 [Candidatus Uhrbacteria bacterium RIFCSPLOWO2_02_FULL_54_37]
MKTRIYAFDFDGTMTDYGGKFLGHTIVDEPRPEVIKAIRILKKQGHKILVHSTRGNAVLQKWCKTHDVPVDYFNENPEFNTENPGKPVAHVYLDDRAVCYRGQTADELVDELNNFQVYYKKK